MKEFAAFLLSLAFAAPAFPPPAELNQGIINTNMSLIAGGGLPNSSTTTTTTFTSEMLAGVTSLQLLIALENLEAYIYSEVILNITGGVYDQEVHVAVVSYTFPVPNLEEFLAVANLITCANFGSFIGIQEQRPRTIASGAASSAILGVETRHDAFLRILHAAWAYNVGLQFTVQWSCMVEPAYTAYPRLTLSLSGPTFSDDSSYPSSVSFTWDPKQASVAREAGKTIYAAWINLYNQPMYTLVIIDGEGSGSTVVPKNMSSMAFMALKRMQPSDFTNLDFSQP
ncbi:hypothetical protein OIDMADRAFT_31220 [Oidiodendron maius Zn]|uniref:Uncharacterized protein n=1 Tax=Oidiodendron maius (strain Zn) TaxID=913774 RepID=A0A0C3D910_OIDMZ|nr:hypothetical protein OIDMADRAFT_31220 [Oidiodendron maius Zn]